MNNNDESSDLLSRTIISLYKQERFYAEILLQMDRVISKKVPTAGVCIKDKIILYVNPDFFSSLTELERVAILKHECQHILNNHIDRAKEMSPDIYAKTGDVIDDIINSQKHKVINIAMDCSINPGIPDMPEGGMLPSLFKLKDGETMEWYTNQLKNNKKLTEITKFDDHSIWSESEGEKEELKEKIKKVINKAAQNTRNCGSMSADDELLVDRLNYKPRDWKSDLKRFAARALETTLRSSRKKRNRRYGVLFPGSVKEELLHIGVALDTSGSVSDDALCQFMAEVGNIAKYATVTVVEADTEVKNSYIFNPKKKYKVKGRGGTAYQPAFDYFTNETEVDGVIYFGDMDCYDLQAITKPKYPVIWAIVGNQKPPVDWGSQTKVEIAKV